MKKLIFGIFAHPDDEAFGPSATLMKEADTGAEVYLICATRGEGGMNRNDYDDLALVRMQEWADACNLIGAKGHFCLDFADGSLNNNAYKPLVTKIEACIRDACESQEGPFELCLMTYDSNGLTGHLDHIAVSSAVTKVFYNLGQSPPAQADIKELAYFCFSEEQMPSPNWKYFCFWPAGYPASGINRRVDVRDYIDRKFAVMRAHESQRSDANYFFDRGNDFHAVDNFYVIR